MIQVGRRDADHADREGRYGGKLILEPSASWKNTMETFLDILLYFE